MVKRGGGAVTFDGKKAKVEGKLYNGEQEVQGKRRKENKGAYERGLIKSIHSKTFFPQRHRQDLRGAMCDACNIERRGFRSDAYLWPRLGDLCAFSWKMWGSAEEGLGCEEKMIQAGGESRETEPSGVPDPA